MLCMLKAKFILSSINKFNFNGFLKFKITDFFFKKIEPSKISKLKRWLGSKFTKISFLLDFWDSKTDFGHWKQTIYSLLTVCDV